MIAKFTAQFIRTAYRNNPFTRKDIAVSTIVFSVFLFGVFSFVDEMSFTADDVPLALLGIELLCFLAFGSYFHILGLQFEHPNEPRKLVESFRKTYFLLPKSTVFLFINLITMVTRPIQLAHSEC